MKLNGHVNGSNALFADYAKATEEALAMQSRALVYASQLKSRGIDVESYGKESPGLSIVSASDLLTQHQSQREVVIDGLLRLGEVMNVIASPKVGKSWLVLLLALCVANGVAWLGRRVTKGRVLLLDNELHPETFAYRLRKVSEATGLSTDGIDFLSLRGQSMDLATLDTLTRSGRGIASGCYSLVLLDALYRMLPAGTSENDNAAMTAVYNLADSIAASTNAAVGIVHHMSKGDQSQKGLTDLGAGAGAISRAADTHLTLRPHTLADSAVLEAVTRSFRQPEPQTIVFNFPVWRATDIPPEVKQPKQPAAANQERRDAETDAAILDAITAAPGRLTSSQIRTRAGFGADRVNRGLARLVKAGTLRERRVKSRLSSKKKTVYEVASEAD